MNHLTSNLDQSLNDHFKMQVEEKVTCAYCLNDFDSEDMVRVKIASSVIEHVCSECYEFNQTI